MHSINSGLHFITCRGAAFFIYRLLPEPWFSRSAHDHCASSLSARCILVLHARHLWQSGGLRCAAELAWHVSPPGTACCARAALCRTPRPPPVGRPRTICVPLCPFSAPPRAASSSPNPIWRRQPAAQRDCRSPSSPGGMLLRRRGPNGRAAPRVQVAQVVRRGRKRRSGGSSGRRFCATIARRAQRPHSHFLTTPHHTTSQ